jgi:hypothetical protein
MAQQPSRELASTDPTTRTQDAGLQEPSTVGSMDVEGVPAGKKEGHELDFIGLAKAQNWKQLQSSDDRDAIFILEEFARDAMQLGGYESSADVF